MTRYEVATTSSKFPKARLGLTKQCPFHLPYHGREEQREQCKAEVLHSHAVASPVRAGAGVGLSLLEKGAAFPDLALCSGEDRLTTNPHFTAVTALKSTE